MQALTLRVVLRSWSLELTVSTALVRGFPCSVFHLTSWLVCNADSSTVTGGLDVGPGGARVMFHADEGTSANVREPYTGAITINVAARTVSI